MPSGVKDSNPRESIQMSTEDMLSAWHAYKETDPNRVLISPEQTHLDSLIPDTPSDVLYCEIDFDNIGCFLGCDDIDCAIRMSSLCN